VNIRLKSNKLYTKYRINPQHWSNHFKNGKEKKMPLNNLEKSIKTKEIKLRAKILMISILLIFSSCEKIKKAIIEEFNSERAEKKTQSMSKELE